MIDTKQNGDYIASLVSTYFSDEQYRVVLKAGEVLFRQGDTNDRLYVLLDGSLRAKQQSQNGHTTELFQAKSHRFVGVYSFFSETYSSVMTLVAEEDCVLAYLDRERFFELRCQGDPLFERFMPVVVTELVNRYRQAQELTIARENAFQKLLETEKVASLGQMAAGVAHELNNAIAVLERNTEWLSETLPGVFELSQAKEFYQKGLAEGYQLSSRERRRKRAETEKRLRVDGQTATEITELGLVGNENWLNDLDGVLQDCHTAWKMGTALHDGLVSSRQAAHVVRSMKILGMPSSENMSGVNVNATIDDALTLAKPLFDGVEVVRDLGEVPSVFGNAGELVQIWLNLIKNACESMAKVPSATLHVKSLYERGLVKVAIVDCGWGIKPEYLPHIFQPNVTTKVDGLSFGLGLGLTIVQRLVHRLDGHVTVESRPGQTIFEIHLLAEER
ncbi:MAG: cyclic nucleotide-binding domain-containing protein [Candidatus Latescibacteria bacterium]|nr:cyclic nucleotide-binding domain-containing protein [Candidatus Latescibacterota bacterium]